MSSALSDEAKKLYNDAKLASFAGKFDEAEAKHVACAYIYERLGSPELAARAYMRSLWYRIQRRVDNGHNELIVRAKALCPFQTMAGLHQALEFAVLEGTEEVFFSCQNVLHQLLRERQLALPQEWENVKMWGTVHAAAAEPIYSLMTQEASRRGWEKWKCSDQARIFYFKAVLSEHPRRAEFLEEAATLFERHEIPYRVHLCRAEAAISKACHATVAESLREHAVAALAAVRSIGSFSLGILDYKMLLMALAEILLAEVENLPSENWLLHAPACREFFAAPKMEKKDSFALLCLLSILHTISNDCDRVKIALKSLPSPSLPSTNFLESRLSWFLSRAKGFTVPACSQPSISVSNAALPQLDKRMIGENLLWSPKGSFKHCVVFVHGLNGHFVDTWGSFPDLISTDPELSKTAFFFWTFPTALWGKQPGIRTVSEALSTELRTRFSQCEFVLVGHSLGGVIAKQMLISELLDKKSSFARRIKWLILYATPHVGSNLATLGHLFNQQISELRLNSETLTDLERRWLQEIYKGRHRRSVGLTNVRGLNDRVVSQWSSSTVYDDVEVVQRDHCGIVKPNSHDDLSYLIMKHRVLNAFKA